MGTRRTSSVMLGPLISKDSHRLVPSQTAAFSVTVVFPSVLLCLMAVPMRVRTSSDAFGALGLIPRLENHWENCPAGFGASSVFAWVSAARAAQLRDASRTRANSPDANRFQVFIMIPSFLFPAGRGKPSPFRSA